MDAKTFPHNSVLIVDDEKEVVDSLEAILESSGIHNIITCTEGIKVLPLIEREKISVMLLDLMMPCIPGEKLLRAVAEKNPEVKTIVVTGKNDIDTAVECMKAGAFDYLVKAVDRNKLISSVRRAIDMWTLQQQFHVLKDKFFHPKLSKPECFSHILFRDEAMHKVLLYVETIALSSQTVLVAGETGVGKQLVAEAVHKTSGRKGEFVELNVAGLDDALFTDSLFGHVRGAYTGADRMRRGMVEKASDGTLFLDEIGEIGPQAQIRLLQLLESGKYYPVGSDTAKRSKARLVAATNKDLRKMVLEGSFRKDLYYRIRSHFVHIPPLRERPGDLPLLIAHFLEEAQRELGVTTDGVERKAFEALRRYDFPGNVRELKMMMLELVGRCIKRSIRREDVLEFLEDVSPALMESERESSLEIYGNFPTIKEATELLVEEALKRTKGNRSLAAGLLGISPPALSKRLKKREESDTD